MKRVTIRRPTSPKQTEKTFGVSTKRSRKIDAMVDEVMLTSGQWCARALARLAYLRALGYSDAYIREVGWRHAPRE